LMAFPIIFKNPMYSYINSMLFFTFGKSS